VILLERIAKLGQMGDTVRVKDGFARNYLLPKGKALRATAANKAKFDGMKVELEVRNFALKGDAEKVATKLNGQSFAVIRQAAETGQLYGSVSARDLADIMTKAGFTVERAQVALNAPIKAIGRHKVPIALHPEVEVSITVNVARSADEAERLGRGEEVLVRREEGDDEDTGAATKTEGAESAAEKFFEPEASKSRASQEGAPEGEDEGEAKPETPEQAEKPAKAARRAKAEKKS
jgi:large subunit ribosomal protein L9